MNYNKETHWYQLHNALGSILVTPTGWLYVICNTLCQASAGCRAVCSGENLPTIIHRYIDRQIGTELLRLTDI